MITLKGGTVGGSTRYPGIHGKHGSSTLFVMEQWYGNEGYLALYHNNVRKVQFRGGEQDAPSFIDNDNNFGIGTQTPRHPLEVVGGIVETGGVIKSNLLVNSGFDVWSQSTLENVATVAEDDCADNSLGGWGSQIRASAAFDTDHYEYSTSGGYNEVMMNNISITAGKLYKIKVDVKSGTGSTTTLQLKLYDGAAHYSNDTGGLPLISTTGSFVTHTYVMEAANTTSNGNFGLFDAVAFANNIEFKNFIVTEVVPGCVNTSSHDALDGWNKDLLTKVWRQHNDGGTYTKDGSFYSLKATFPGGGYEVQYPRISTDSPHTKAEWYQRFAGRTMTFGAWVKSSNGTILRINDSAGNNPSPAHTGGGGWEWLEVTHACDSSITSFALAIRGGASETVYVSQPMLVFGSAIGEGNYTRPAGEVIWFDKRVASNALNAIGFSDVAFTTLNTEADSNGKVPKGARSLFVLAESNDSASASNNTFFRLQGNSVMDRLLYASCAGLANDRGAHTASWQPCDSNGDFQYMLEASGSGTLDIYLNYVGVQLR